MARPRHEDRIFRALADPTRRRILDLLKRRELTTGQLCEELAPLDRCTTMLHLSVLARADLVIVRREGRFRWNSLNSAPIQMVYDRWVSRYAAPSLRLLTQLKRDVEGSAPRPPAGRISGTPSSTRPGPIPSTD